jgi:hypothetical protein
MKEESGAGLVDSWIMGKKWTFTVLGTFFLCPTIFLQVSQGSLMTKIAGKQIVCVPSSCMN